MNPQKLFRMIVRVDRGLGDALTEIAARLLVETTHDYSRSAIVRGLVAIGLRTIAGAPHVTPFFVGTRVPRGRKPGGRRLSAVMSRVGLDLENEEDPAR